MLRLKESKYGLIALALNITEAILIWGSLAVVRELGLWGRAPLWLEKALSAAYLGGAAALIFAVVGFIKDSERSYAAVALFVGLVNLGLCGLVFVV